MANLEEKGEIHKEPISVVKMHSITSTSKENIKRLHRISNQRQRLSPDFCLSGKFSTEMIDTARKQPKSSRFERFFKKQLKTHEVTIKKNPRINLIENTQRIISNNQSKIQKYVLHSTKKLQILSESYQEKKSCQQKFKQNNSYFISIMSDRDEAHTPIKQNGQKRRKSPESRRLCKGTTMRKRQANMIGRFSASAELDRYNNNKSQFQNQQQLPQQSKLTLYQSLIYTRKLKAQSVGTHQFMQSSLYVDDSKLDRQRFLQSQNENKAKNRQLYHQQKEREFKQQFPRKKGVEGSSPEVLKINLRQVGYGLRGALLTQKFDRREHYQPRSMQIAGGGRRPNTTTVNDRRRKDSQIEPW